MRRASVFQAVLLALALVALARCESREYIEVGAPCPPPGGPTYCDRGMFCVMTPPIPGDQCSNGSYSCDPFYADCNPQDLCHCGALLDGGERGPTCNSCRQLQSGFVECSP